MVRPLVSPIYSARVKALDNRVSQFPSVRWYVSKLVLARKSRLVPLGVGLPSGKGRFAGGG